MDIVSKCLHHSTSSITEAFYLKESAAQVNARANIPWMRGEGAQRTEAVLPTFLGGDVTTSASDRTAKKRRRIDAQLHSLAAFKPLPPP